MRIYGGRLTVKNPEPYMYPGRWTEINRNPLYVAENETIMAEKPKVPKRNRKIHPRTLLWTREGTKLSATENLRIWVYDQYQREGCRYCNEREIVCLEFHHRDHHTKIGSISRMIRDSLPKEMIVAEIEKCDLLCANCHRKLHARILPMPYKN